MNTALVRLGPVLLVGCLALTSGCARPRITLYDPASSPGVDWVLATPQALVLEWHLYPGIHREWVSALQMHEGQLVIICNSNTPAEVMMPLSVYIVDPNRGTLIRALRGPSHAYVPDGSAGPVTDDGLWVTHSRGWSMIWSVMDLRSGHLTSAVAPPKDLQSEGGAPCRLVSYSEDPWRHEYHYVYELQNSAAIAIDLESKTGGEIRFSFRLAPDAPPVSLTLPYKYAGGMDSCVAVRNGPHLIVGYGAYVIAFHTEEGTE
jgi:hypothetical protein